MLPFWTVVCVNLLLLVSFSASSEDFTGLSKHQSCYLRCTANCLQINALSVDQCSSQCNGYNTADLCTPDDNLCWSTCSGLTAAVNISIPINLSFNFTASSALNLTWNNVDANLFYIQHSNVSDFDKNFVDFLTTKNTLVNWTNKYGTFCDEQYFRIYAVSPGGVSNAATAYVPSPSPRLNTTLELISLKYLNQPYRVSFHESNASLEIVFQYHKTDWPLGDNDLEVIPMFHMINCDIPDLSSAIPQPLFVQGPQPRTLTTVVGADLMYRKCQFVYYINEVRSRTCTDAPSIQNPDSNSMKSIRIDCSMVKDAPCEPHVKSFQPPLCGLFDHFEYKVLNKNINAKDPSTNVTVNITFRSTLSPNKKPLYFVAFYGDAKNFPRIIETDLFGVDLLNVTGNSTNCPQFNMNGTCAIPLNPVNGSIVITNLRMDRLYGVTVCAVMDATNLNFPVLTNQEQNTKSKASKIYIESKLYHKSHTVEIVVGVLASIIVFSFAMAIVFYCFYRKKSRAEKFAKMKVAQLEREQEKRYTDLPKKQDVWELERRNLILYDDKKLGSGAFGAVYMGKLIGIARGHKDAQSTLGINLMRAENCDVAVKMLPEYADALSKSEFLKEIALMKTLGYHERLVNMLACITETEPYCLIVEYCSDGDLLHFLRERCNYMLKLTDIGIDYDNPGPADDVDYEMIITLKQLLMFAVQISFGLEYLSQKGFVHRDVAARNVLVHDKVNAKIGDFGLCRYIYAESANYKAKGGRLPVKWMSPEAIKFYEFTTKSDVWSFGILMFEIITLGGAPYPGVQPDDVMEYLENGGRMEKPDNCPDEFYDVMKSCWHGNPQLRPDFGMIRQKLAGLLEDVTDEYSYLKLDSQRDYYNVTYGEVPKNVEDASKDKDGIDDNILKSFSKVSKTATEKNGNSNDSMNEVETAPKD